MEQIEEMDCETSDPTPRFTIRPSYRQDYCTFYVHPLYDSGIGNVEQSALVRIIMV